MTIDLNILRDYEERGLVCKQAHPLLPLFVWNYTRSCQYDNLWDDVTLACRCLITDFEGNIIARGFNKFFNLEQHKNNEIPNEPFDVYEKLDGSYICVFYYNNTWVVSSKGSFASDVSIAANKYFIDNNYNNLLDKNLTYIFEYIGKLNRIVCEYPFDEKLALISVFNKNNEINLNEIDIPNINKVKRYDGITDYRKLKDIFNGDNREGFVIRFKSGFRVKIKYDEYIRLHRIITNITSYDIWEHLKNNKDIENLLQEVPDEFDGWVRDQISLLNSKFKEKKKEIENEFWTILNKKEIAEKFKNCKNKHLLFKRLTSYSLEYEEIIWDKIKPKFQKPFRTI
jgi:RNA ligase